MSNNWLLDCDSEKPALEADTTLYISIPGELICTRLVKLPPLPNKNREQVIGYALEEQIASSLDDIKIIAGQTNSDGKTPVLWCRQTNYEQWLDKWSDCQPESMLPDYLYLPLSDHAWTLRCQHGRFLLRTGIHSGVALESNQLLDYLKLVDILPEQLIYDGDEPSTDLHDFCKQHGIVLRKERLALFATPTDQSLSLLPKQKWQWKKEAKRWRLPAILAALSALILVSGSLWYSATEKKVLKYQQQQLASLYHQADPKHALPANPVMHLQHLKRKLQAGLHPDRALHRLLLAGQLIHRHPNIQLQSFDAQPKVLTLTLTSPSKQTVDKLVAELKQSSPTWTAASASPPRSDEEKNNPPSHRDPSSPSLREGPMARRSNSGSDKHGVYVITLKERT